MSIVRVGHGTVATGTDPVPGAPGGLKKGDILFCLCRTAGTGVAAPTMGSEWTLELIANGTGALGAAVNGRIFSFRYQGQAPNYQVTAGTSGWAVVVAFRASNRGNVVRLDQAVANGTSGATSATVDYDSLTPNETDQHRWWIWLVSAACTNGAISGSNPTPTEQLDSDGGYADGAHGDLTATGARTSTLSTAVINVGITALLVERPGPGYLTVPPHQRTRRR